MMGLVLVLTIGAAAGEDTAIDVFFAEFAKKRDGIVTLRARFTQESVVPDETLRTAGTIIYVKPKRIVFRYDAPDPIYLIDDLRVYEYAPDLAQLQIYDLEDNPQTEAFFLGFDEDARQLRQGYDVELLTPEDAAPGARVVRLRPKKDEEQEAPFQEVTLYLRAEDYLPYRIHVVNDAESHVTIWITDFTVNQPLEPGLAQIDLPEGTAIIAHEQGVERVGAGGKRVPEAGGPPATQTAPGDEKASTP